MKGQKEGDNDEDDKDDENDDDDSGSDSDSNQDPSDQNKKRGKYKIYTETEKATIINFVSTRLNQYSHILGHEAWNPENC